MPAISECPDYTGRDLEAMSFAANYHRWILQLFKPLGKRVVEVGAGTGAFSELLLENQLDSLALVEPSKGMFDILKAQLDKLRPSVRVTTYNSFFGQVANEIRETQLPDSIIYVNVLEHIADDQVELEIVRQTLSDSGRVFIFVPALQWLYGGFDKQVGHYRRYSKAELERRCRAAGFKIIRSLYFDLAGVIPWWIKYRLLKSDELEPQAVKMYDRYAVPAVKVFESILEPPIGKNILLIAEKN